MAVLAEINKTTRFLKVKFYCLHKSVFMSKLNKLMLFQKNDNMKFSLQSFTYLSSVCCSDFFKKVFANLFVINIAYTYTNHVRSTSLTVTKIFTAVSESRSAHLFILGSWNLHTPCKSQPTCFQNEIQQLF
ncbi:hypothetical protein Nmel_005775 [Mimus melanotis]